MYSDLLKLIAARVEGGSTLTALQLTSKDKVKGSGDFACLELFNEGTYKDDIHRAAVVRIHIYTEDPLAGLNYKKALDDLLLGWGGTEGACVLRHMVKERSAGSLGMDISVNKYLTTSNYTAIVAEV